MMRPSSLSVALLLAAAAFTALAWYFGFRRRGFGVWRMRGAFVVGMCLTGFAAYGTWREGRTVLELAAIVPPFPRLETASWLPTLRTSDRHWVFTTRAVPAEVLGFHAADEHRRGWTLTSQTEARSCWSAEPTACG